MRLCQRRPRQRPETRDQRSEVRPRTTTTDIKPRATDLDLTSCQRPGRLQFSHRRDIKDYGRRIPFQQGLQCDRIRILLPYQVLTPDEIALIRFWRERETRPHFVEFFVTRNAWSRSLTERLCCCPRECASTDFRPLFSSGSCCARAEMTSLSRPETATRMRTSRQLQRPKTRRCEEIFLVAASSHR